MINKRGNMRKLIVAILLIAAPFMRLMAVNPPDEGMWLPILIERLNYVDMQKMGLHLTPQELYDINHSSLKDAIVGLSGNGASSGGFFCTAEVVSGQGLIFTNHHCGYNAVQSHSTTEHDYLTNGFWAKSLNEELPNEAMCASFLVRIENVTDSIIPHLSDTMKENSRNSVVRDLSAKIRKRAEEGGKYEASVKAFYGGNEYYLFVFKTYRDVRLVGAPPSSIGKFGGDTDNWMWPRHTGDFTVFRIYGDADGNPAEYSDKNVPIKPAYHLPISLKGIKKNDFAMIWGYPGTTTRYLTSYGVEYNMNVFYPIYIDLFGKQLEVMKERMDADNAVKIAYSDNYAGIANTWKNFIGQAKMLKKNKVEEKKKAIEDSFVAWYSADPVRKEKYGKVLDDLKSNYAAMTKVATPFFYATMGGLRLDLVQLASSFNQLYGALEKKNKAAVKELQPGLMETIKEHFKENDQLLEKKKMAEILKMYAANVKKEDLPSIFQVIAKDYKNDFGAFVDKVYEESVFATEASATKFAGKPALKTMEKDLGWQLYRSILAAQGKYNSIYMGARSGNTAANRLFIAGLREMNPNLVKYPDANSTMRMTYGEVLDYFPADAVQYNYITTLKGVMQKEDPSNDEFIVDQKLKDLYQAKDYGPYGENGELVTCFLTTNDITGGNSGSPVINGDGQLIGLAFDGNWEAMSGDILFEENLQRCINVDIRYVLFIIDKFANATNIIDELTLVK